MSGLVFKGAKAKELSDRMRKRRQARMLDDFAEHLSTGQTIEEAAFLAGGKRKEGREMLHTIRNRLGFDLTE